MNLQSFTYILVIIASVMAIAWFVKQGSKEFTYECGIAQAEANRLLKNAYNSRESGDPNNKLIERAGHYANYYEAFCS